MNDETRKKIMSLAIKLNYVKTEERKKRTKEEILDILYDIFPEIGESAIKFAATSAIEMHNSFLTSVYQAGGAGWSLEELFNMTYFDLLNSLATNGVMFVFEMAR